MNSYTSNEGDAFNYFKTIPLICMMVLIYIISDQPGDSLPDTGLVNIDKIYHCIEYAILAATFLFAFNQQQTKKAYSNKLYISTILFCIFFGITDEWHQSFVPQRSSSIFDVLADGTGAIIMTFSVKKRKWRLFSGC